MSKTELIINELFDKLQESKEDISEVILTINNQSLYVKYVTLDGFVHTFVKSYDDEIMLQPNYVENEIELFLEEKINEMLSDGVSDYVTRIKYYVL